MPGALVEQRSLEERHLQPGNVWYVVTGRFGIQSSVLPASSLKTGTYL